MAVATQDLCFLDLCPNAVNRQAVGYHLADCFVLVLKMVELQDDRIGFPTLAAGVGRQIIPDKFSCLLARIGFSSPYVFEVGFLVIFIPAFSIGLMAVTTGRVTNSKGLPAPIEVLFWLPLSAGCTLFHNLLFKVYLRSTILILKSESLIPSPYMAVRMASDPIYW
jgi:hypothetical protein